jgi:hypothetical protein
MKAAALAILSCLVAAAQVPPPLLRIIRSPGPQVLIPPERYSAARAQVEVLGLRAATGLPETWNIEMHSNFASLEDLGTALGDLPAPPTNGCADDVLGAPRTMIAYYQGGWGYRSEEAVRLLPRARYMHVTIYRMRPGGEDELEKSLVLRRKRMDAVNFDHPDLVYHVISGGNSGLYIALAPMVSLRKLDEGVAKFPAYAEPDAAAEAQAGQAAASAQISRESLLFRLDPRISYVSADFAAPDPGFWHP